MSSIKKQEHTDTLIELLSLNKTKCPKCKCENIKDYSYYSNYSSSYKIYYYEVHIIDCCECDYIGGNIYKHPDYRSVIRYELMDYDPIYKIYKVKRLPDVENSYKVEKLEISYFARIEEDNVDYLCVAEFEKSNKGNNDARKLLFKSKFNAKSGIEVDIPTIFRDLSKDWSIEKRCFRLTD